MATILALIIMYWIVTAFANASTRRAEERVAETYRKRYLEKYHPGWEGSFDQELFDKCKWPHPEKVPQPALDDWRRYYREDRSGWKPYPPYGVDLYDYDLNDPDPNKRRAIHLYHEERDLRYRTLRGQALSQLQQILYQKQLFEYEYREELMKEDPEAAAKLPVVEKPVPLGTGGEVRTY